MATSYLPRELCLAQHAFSLLLLLVMAGLLSLAPFTTLKIGSATASDVLASAQHGINAAEAACSCAPIADASTTSTGLSYGARGIVFSDDVLVFQTSWFIACPLTGNVSPPSGSEPPVRVIIATPTQSGTYPVILFKHGFELANCFYTQLFQSLASSGYIVVAPQASIIVEFDCTKEIEDTANVANWIPLNLETVLKKAMPNADVVPDASKLVMAGHSRGGKIAFTMALGMAQTKFPSISALIALDPVDGMSTDLIPSPPVVGTGCNYAPMPFPVLILGAGYSSQNGMLGMMACAPTCCNHAAFFNCTSSARIMYHLVASEYGHLDFLDDSQIWTGAMCKAGSDKAALRDFSVKLMVAFLELALQGKEDGMDGIVNNWENASITLEEPEIKYAQDDVQREHISKAVLQEQHSEL